jgi:sodium transport system permease protein
MNWSNVRLILAREIRDQLRDRRTLFMIAVLPLLLYPLLGMSFFQVTQFMKQRAVRVLVVGAPATPDVPPLVDGDRFSAGLFDGPTGEELLQVTSEPVEANHNLSEPDRLERARADMAAHNCEVAVYFPADFASRFDLFHKWLLLGAEQGGSQANAGQSAPEIPKIEVYPNLAKDSSRAAHRRVLAVLERWREEIGERNLEASKLPAKAAKPFEIGTLDVAEEGQHKAAVWSKILPFVLLIWALTGAFYPAIDLCAGEKERGTLETLLSSPAERIEIVWGKLLTIMLFSMATAILNLASLSITGSLILSQMPNLGAPPGLSILWLLIALVPVSALFSALCLALAALARSTKEGQYYLMPLVLITMPLTILPMAPGVTLNLGNSLIPVTGVVLLLRGMLEGNYLEILPYVPLVVAVTLGCCWLAIRWATSQFNTESVLFRESERWDLKVWLKHLLRDRQPTPSVAEAMFCGVMILFIRFFMSFSLAMPDTFRDFAVLAAVTELVVIATPALLMTVMLTRNPAETLLLRKPPLAAPLAAVLLAVVLHPAANLLQFIVSRVYPLDEQLAAQLNRMFVNPDSIWVMLAVVAVLPAICEELAFRGFILSGFRHLGHKWTAIALSSIFFGAAHVLFQQSLIACLMGMLIGFLAIQSGSLLPGLLFHIVHNSLAVLVAQITPALADQRHWLHWLMRDAADEGPLYRWPVVVASLLASGLVLAWFQRLPYARTAEESLQEAIEHQSATWQPG